VAEKEGKGVQQRQLLRILISPSLSVNFLHDLNELRCAIG
jgi:hypothetical protein